MLGTKVFITDKIDNGKGGGGSKCVKLKTERSKSQKLAKF